MSCNDSPVLEPLPAGDVVEVSAARPAHAGPPMHATVTFGRDKVGSPFRPPDPHDASFHAIDKITPHAAEGLRSELHERLACGRDFE